MHQAVGDADVDEQAESRHMRHRSFEDVADSELRGRPSLALPAQLLGRRLLREDEPVALRIDLDDFQRQVLADERAYRTGHAFALRGTIQRAERRELRERHEPTYAQVNDDATAVRLHDGRLEDFPTPLLLGQLLPSARAACATQRQHGVPLRALGMDDEREHGVADLERLIERRVRVAQ
ncbi:MAG TPA: hypothetical protein DCK98_16490 [Chloroflexi bacterium]|nr:hypothetical protein [Chloroflexota bacterium]HAL27591.1 hypothetical protein [Chloroflexota bacterium]